MLPLNHFAVVVHPTEVGALRADNIAVAKKDIPGGMRLLWNGSDILVTRSVPRGSSFAILPIPKGHSIIALGVHVGFAARHIPAGGLLDAGGLGNVLHEIDRPDKVPYGSRARPTEYRPEWMARTYLGFPRQVTHQGKLGAGTQNLVVLLNTVKCSQVATQNLAFRARQQLLPKFPHVTDVVAITQEYGCGMPVGPAKQELARILTRVMNHPNVGAVYLLGLGCEHLCPIPGLEGSVIPYFEETVLDFARRVRTDHLQRYCSELEAVEKIVQGPLQESFEFANQFSRQPVPIASLTLGLKCGGSDRFSGVSANPALGVAVDRLISGGGAAIITETPEFEGYMHVMAERARDPSLGQWLMNLIPRFDKLSSQYPIPERGRQTVAPGNYAGGLLNIFMKSAGAASKAGSTCVEGGLEYADWIYDHDRRGLWVLDGPSYDQISTPALGLSGCQMVVFTTGRGTPIGSALGQVIKVGSTAEVGLDQHVDFSAQAVLDGEPIEKVGGALLEKILAIASGKEPTALEVWNRRLLEAGLPYAHHEFMPWKRWGDN
ncbi:MAG: UxaA family hydrolase [Planctomycetes bacterium]|nr:UxaA family hydrolase [Planctomycetota bacterium]